MGKKRAKGGNLLTSARPFPTRDLAQITDEHIAWVEAGSYARGPMALPAVYASVRLIASTINQLPVQLDDGSEPDSWLLYPRQYGASFDLNDLVQFIVTSMALKGAAYLQCTPTDVAREVWRIEPVSSDNVQAVGSSDGGPLSLAFKMGGDEVPHVPVKLIERVRDRAYLLHIPYLVTPDYPQGLSPIHAARQSVEGYGSVERQAANLLGSGTYSGGRLETEQDITKATAERFQETWVANRKIGNLPVLGAGLKYVNDLIDPSDAQWLESRQYNNQQIAMMFGIPPDYLGMSMSGGSSSLSYANSQDNDRRFRRNCLAAFTQQISDSFSMLLPRGGRVVFDYTRWEGEGDAPQQQQQPDGPALDDTGQRGRHPHDRGHSDPLEQTDHLRRDTGIIRTGIVRLDGSDRETAAVESQPGRTDRAHHDGQGLGEGSGDLSGDPSDVQGQRRDDAPKRWFDLGFVRRLRSDRTAAGEGRGAVHEGAPARTITYPVAGVPVGDSDSNER